MHNPLSLVLSRHNVYYFRWSIPKHLHPQGKFSDIKLSLGTRCPQEALQIVRSLLYFADNAIISPAVMTMDYQELRDILHAHFKEMRDKVKDRIAAKGRLTKQDVEVLRTTSQLAREALQKNDFELIGDDAEVTEFMLNRGVSVQPTDAEFSMVRKEFLAAFRSYCDSVVELDGKLDSYDYGAASEQNVAMKPALKAPRHRPMKDEIAAYISEKLTLGDWTEKSANGFKSQLSLIPELLGEDVDVDITHDLAQSVKRMLLNLPKNSRSNPNLKKLSIHDLMNLNAPPAQRMAKKNIAKYLDTYTAFYDWVEKRKLVTENPFKSLRIKISKRTQVRDAFTPEQIAIMLDEIKNNRKGIVKKDYQKWGALIGIYTGARLNEIAQLTLADIRKEDGIWCFDLNDEGDGKSLKNENSKRLVPIHDDLMAHGLIEHVEALRKDSHTRLLHELSFDKNNGWGRNLGRWFNTVFLPKLGIKTDGLVFHSTRHSILTYLLQAGVQEPIAKAISGHAQTGVVQTVYAHGYKVRQLKDALDLLYTDLPAIHAAPRPVATGGN